jgi:molybdenum cofactor synthesis domain-containing protein
MTGAPLPQGARGVQRIEWTEPAGESLVRFVKPESIDNIIRRAENQRAGETLLTRRLLQPQDVGILASSGYARVPVAARPVVGVLSTGDELAAPGSPLPPAAIYDSNGPLLAAALAACGCVVRDYGAVRDEPGELDSVVSRGLEECDVLIASGGVSAGDFDYVPRALEAAGVTRVFHGLAMQPGRPTYYGRRGSKAAFGLPGTPVSVFVNLEVMVKAHLYRRLGLRRLPRSVAARLAAPLARRGSDRVVLLPASLQTAGGATLATPLAYRGSSMLNVLADADCLLRMEIGEEHIEAGRMVLARLIRA